MRALPPPPPPRPRTGRVLLAGLLSASVGLVGLTLAGSGTATADVAPNVNVVANGDFAAGNHISPWTCGPTVTAVNNTATGWDLQGAPAGNDYANCSQSVTVLPNSTYTLSAVVQGGYVFAGVTGTGGTDPSTWSSNAGWNTLTSTFTTGASTTSVSVWFHGWYGQTPFTVDKVSLVGPGTAPGSPSPTPTIIVDPTPSPSQSSPKPSPSVTEGTPTGSTSPSGSPTAPPPRKHLLTGYWQDFYNGATPQRISDVPAAYDIIAVAFADATSTRGGLSFTLDPTLSSKLGGYTEAQFKADIAAKRAAGKKVIISVGGQNGTVSVSDSASATTFANSAYSLIQQYGFDGIDIDLENGVNATYMSQALHSLAAKVGSGFVLTMAPETIGMQSTGGEYFKLALATKDILTIVNMQYYNSGAMLGCDGGVYSQGTENFLTGLACIQLQGGLRPDQVGLGVPASTSAAGGGYISPATVNNALDCLASGTNCGSFKPSQTWPTIGGAMTWSTNWDATAGNQIANTIGAHLHAMP
ncbi:MULTISPECIES: glycosyl hydrolase family 18 protein [Kitasatospora]|uniref:chitinase n=1 Tax=Kitasatospora setae (strain ATCC 33774 / DSM 43861 / JCM 3304 / KCC A-0304 / NBRC 14216 / KM-6054) TaxID=452652 RepID=E4NB52_KITSK|nr:MULTISPECIES: glycosyl hydrolase family 18 protein [Kitasatospora]BAJ28433.1 putative chitinase A [Kitasatospora setae KM-6054]